VQLVNLTADDPRLVEFHRGIYWDAFAAQHEPIESWQRALRGEDAYQLTVRLALDGELILGGISYERYPRSGCGFVTYLVVAPAARGFGLGKGLQTAAVADLFAAGAPAVFGEINDPRHDDLEPAEVAVAAARNQRLGARVLETRHVQPALSLTLQRSRPPHDRAAGRSTLPPSCRARSSAASRGSVRRHRGRTARSEMAVGERVRLLLKSPSRGRVKNRAPPSASGARRRLRLLLAQQLSRSARRDAAATSSATSRTSMSSSLSRCFMPSVIMMLQNGQATATVWTPVAMISSVRFTLTRSPCSSMNIRPPPAPQQKPWRLRARAPDPPTLDGGEEWGARRTAVPAPR
jgi:hypothetical protein